MPSFFMASVVLLLCMPTPLSPPPLTMHTHRILVPTLTLFHAWQIVDGLDEADDERLGGLGNGVLHLLRDGFARLPPSISILVTARYSVLPCVVHKLCAASRWFAFTSQMQMV